MKITNFNFIGDFKAKRGSGNVICYKVGDVVYHESKTYIASKKIEGLSPSLGEKAGWLSLSDRSVLYESSSEPFHAELGDEWFDTSSGVLYKRIENNSIHIWVEL